jgi:succinate dehydrogenase/fumarate reductase flavoprotein subunit
LRISEKTESTLPGLYAAGEVAAGPHGADRMGGCMVSATQVFGARAGKFAAERAKNIDEVTIDQKQVDYICHGASKIMANKGVIKVSEIENKIRNLMWRNCLTVRSQKGLEDCIKELKRIKYEELPKLSITDNIETFRALAIPNMLDAAQMIANAALQRKESRGTHFREDFSSKDDINWLKPVNINKRDTDLG